MKKVISIMLLLALCIGCFAGCASKEADTSTPTTSATMDPALKAARDYVFAMYKDGSKRTASDYTVLSQVLIEGVAFPITWSTDVSEDLVKITASENNTTVIDVNEKPENDVTYKLTATLKNAKGETASVSFEKFIPAAPKAPTASSNVLFYGKDNKFITGKHFLYEAKNKWELELSENKADALVITVVDNGDGTVTFKSGEHYLFCDATNVKFVTTQDDNTKFVLEAADTDGGYFIKCAVANFNGKAQYLEVYSGYLTCYGMGSDASIYTFKLDTADGASGAISGLTTETPAPDNNPPATNPPATNPPATNPPAVSTGASLTLDLSGVTMAAEGDYANLESDAILAALQAGASGAGLVSAEGTKVYAGNNNSSGAFPMSGGNFKVGSSKNDGQLVLKFSKKVAKVEIVCHDWYSKSADHPTNSNTLAVNGSATQLAPYTETPTAGTLTFALDGSSDTVTIDVSKRAFVFKIVVTFVA